MCGKSSLFRILGEVSHTCIHVHKCLLMGGSCHFIIINLLVCVCVPYSRKLLKGANFRIIRVGKHCSKF